MKNKILQIIFFCWAVLFVSRAYVQQTNGAYNVKIYCAAGIGKKLDSKAIIAVEMTLLNPDSQPAFRADKVTDLTLS